MPYSDQHCPPGYTVPGVLASCAVARVEDTLGEIEKLADDIYAVSRLDAEDNLHRAQALDRLEGFIRAALAAWRAE